MSVIFGAFQRVKIKEDLVQLSAKCFNALSVIRTEEARVIYVISGSFVFYLRKHTFVTFEIVSKQESESSKPVIFKVSK